MPRSWPMRINLLLARQGEMVSMVGKGGNDRVVSCIPEDVKGQPVAILSRTVAGGIGAALDASLVGKKVYWVRGISGYKTAEPEGLYWFRLTCLSECSPCGWRGNTATLMNLSRLPEQPGMLR